VPDYNPRIMAETAVIRAANWQDWEGRVVGGQYQLLQLLESTDESGLYLTKFDGAAAAIKLLRAGAPEAGAQVASWNLASRLSHPHLVRIFDVGTWHADEELDMHFAVMEHCEENLADVLRVRPLTPDEARVMLAPTLDAIEYLHGQGVVYGNLNPTNVRARGDQLKLASEGLRLNGEAAGSYSANPYGAPERASSFSGDIWSLGMMLCESLTKQLPPRDKDGSPQLPQNLPDPFDATVKQCLAVDREKRISIGGIRNFLHRPAVDVQLKPPVTQPQASPVDLRLVRSATPGRAMKDAPEERRSAPWMDRRHLVIGALALLLLTAILIGVRVTHSRPANKVTPAVISSTSGAATRERRSAEAPRGVAPVPGASGAVLQRVMPDVAEKARSTINGTVKVKVLVQVDAEGRVTVAGLGAKSPSAYFGKKSLDAARQWTFSAPVREGRAQSSQWIIRFEFRRSGTRAAAQMTSPA
jgi:TonB family protein